MKDLKIELAFWRNGKKAEKTEIKICEGKKEKIDKI